ncbi:hypothetical protein Q4567_06345 [Aliiglaciecola sp. 2_MG-2023]|uniref:ImmA/IrrE family metallo-endopeptidase n=1 Tax=unclassified Aliiglaciecola TaxID=2593648 RepID=UPI0026E3B45B|nr:MULTISPECIES: hypothetical protein [unclassified Aliiglaciecola]MDO6710332.1 hypothetical protein [Aliiglaciecola sp. 2_MG-2023]MDO6751479.1 hypothetical protein [Aliiglaciecola sp. 1_MG-2023]
MPTGLQADEDYVDTLVEQCSGFIPQEITSLLDSERLIAKSISFDGIMALTKRIQGEPDSYAVVLSNGLRRIVYEVARVSINMMYNGGHPDFDGLFNRSADNLVALFYYLLDADLPIMSSGRGGEVHHNVAFDAGVVALTAEKFYLLHEFGHVWLFESGDHDVLPLHEREYYCDTFASSLLINNSGHLFSAELADDQRATEHFKKLTYYGIYLALAIYDAAGALGLQLSDSHPSGLKRQKFVRRNIRANYGNDYLLSVRKLALAGENFLHEVHERIEHKKNQGDLEWGVFMQQADELIEYLKNLKKHKNT